MANHHVLDARIAELRARLAANLGELQHRVTRVRRLMSPRSYLENTWAQVGIGVAIGYLAGRRRGPKQLTSGHARDNVESLVHAALRSAVMALAASVIQRALGSAKSDDQA
jgi:hypothetical protein